MEDYEEGGEEVDIIMPFYMSMKFSKLKILKRSLGLKEHDYSISLKVSA